MRAHTSCIFPKHDFWPFVDDDGVAAMISKLKKACCCLKVGGGGGGVVVSWVLSSQFDLLNHTWCA